MLDLVYYLWYDAQQLARAAQILQQVKRFAHQLTCSLGDTMCAQQLVQPRLASYAFGSLIAVFCLAALCFQACLKPCYGHAMLRSVCISCVMRSSAFDFVVMLLQAIEMMADVITERQSLQPDADQDDVQQSATYAFGTLRLMELAASAGAFLGDLLHMRALAFSPLSITAVGPFVKACQGMLEGTY